MRRSKNWRMSSIVGLFLAWPCQHFFMSFLKSTGQSDGICGRRPSSTSSVTPMKLRPAYGCFLVNTCTMQKFTYYFNALNGTWENSGTGLMHQIYLTAVTFHMIMPKLNMSASSPYFSPLITSGAGNDLVSANETWHQRVRNRCTSPGRSATASHRRILLFDPSKPKVCHLHIPILIHLHASHASHTSHTHH